MHDMNYHLSAEDRKAIAEILCRRSNELASFRQDLNERVSKLTDSKVRFYELPGSVELAISREIDRLRLLESKLKDKKSDEAETEEE